MVDKIWLGGIFLKNEGGYEIVLKSLGHYKKRLQTIGNSPELKEAAAMFAPVLQQQAVKTIPKIDETISKIQDVLSDTKPIDSLRDDVQFLQRALECYQSDIDKAENTGLLKKLVPSNEYSIGLVPGPFELTFITPVIPTETCGSH